MRIQCSWTFCRSVMSAVPRANSCEISPMTRSCCGGQPPAVDADPQHEVLVVQLLRLQDRGLAAVDPGLALGVQAPPAHPAAQVVGVDRVEAALGVDRLNACPHIETVVVLLELLVAVERREVAHGPLALAAVASGLAAGRGGCGRSAGWRPWVYVLLGGSRQRTALAPRDLRRHTGRRVATRRQAADQGVARPRRWGRRRSVCGCCRGRRPLVNASARRTDGAGHAAEVDVPPTHQGNSSSRHDGSVSRRSPDQSTVIQNVDTSVPHRETSVVSVTSGRAGLCRPVSQGPRRARVRGRHVGLLGRPWCRRA